MVVRRSGNCFLQATMATREQRVAKVQCLWNMRSFVDLLQLISLTIAKIAKWYRTFWLSLVRSANERCHEKLYRTCIWLQISQFDKNVWDSKKKNIYIYVCMYIYDVYVYIHNKYVFDST